jgi:hypothetical protein
MVFSGGMSVGAARGAWRTPGAYRRDIGKAGQPLEWPMAGPAAAEVRIGARVAVDDLK